MSSKSCDWSQLWQTNCKVTTISQAYYTSFMPSPEWNPDIPLFVSSTHHQLPSACYQYRTKPKTLPRRCFRRDGAHYWSGSHHSGLISYLKQHFHSVLSLFFLKLVGQLLIITGVCHQFLKPLKLSLTKQKKKKKQASNIEMVGHHLIWFALHVGRNHFRVHLFCVQPVTFSTFASHLTNMESAIESLQRSVKELNPAELSLDISSLSLTESGESHLTAYVSRIPAFQTRFCAFHAKSFPCYSIQLQIQADQEKKMWQDIQSSYQQSSKELSDYLALKIQYLHSLKL